MKTSGFSAVGVLLKRRKLAPRGEREKTIKNPQGPTSPTPTGVDGSNEKYGTRPISPPPIIKLEGAGLEIGDSRWGRTGN